MDINLGKVDYASVFDQSRIKLFSTIFEDLAHCGDDYFLCNENSDTQIPSQERYYQLRQASYAFTTRLVIITFRYMVFSVFSHNTQHEIYYNATSIAYQKFMNSPVHV